MLAYEGSMKIDTVGLLSRIDEISKRRRIY